MAITADNRRSKCKDDAAGRSNPRDLRAALTWAVVVTLSFFAIYGSCIWLTFLRDKHNPGSVGISFFRWERSIPFLPWMIVPYSSEDIFFFFAPFVCRNRIERRTHGRRVFAALA